MKRLFTAALALALTLSSTPAGMLTARAEEPAAIEAPVEEADTFELGSDEAEAPADTTEVEEIEYEETDYEAVDTIQSNIEIGQYAHIAAQAALYDTPDGVCVGTLSTDGTVEVLARENDWARVAVSTEQGVLPLWVEAGSIALLDEQQAIEYLNGPADFLGIEPVQIVEEAKAEERSEAIEVELATAPKATGIKLNYTSGTIGVGETYKGLDFTVTPSNASRDVTWSTSSSKIATVNANGEITGHKTGTATITVKTASGKKATCKVKVKKAPSSVTVTPTTMKLGYGGATGKLGVKVGSDYACNAYTYSSSDRNVATVDASGVVTSVNGGSATITVTAYNGATGTCKVTVTGAPAKVQLDSNVLSLGTGETATLTAKAYDQSGNPTEAALTYAIDPRSPAPNCISVSASGQVKGLTSGQAIVRVSAANGVYAACAVDVTALPVAIKLNHTTVTLAVGETYKGLEAILTPPSGDTTCSTKVTWVSKKTKYVTVNAETGELKGIKEGSTEITATTSNGLKATCKVTVKKAPGSISLSPSTLTLSAGGMSEALKLVVSSSSALNSATFTSSNPAIAEVDGNGVVTSGKEGTAIITATSFNGKTAKCTVKVAGEPASVQLDRTAITVSVGEKTSVTATALTAAGNAAMSTLTYFVEPSSPNPACVTVNEKTGAITALTSGTAYINAKAHNGIVGSYPCEVKVTAKPTALTLPESLAMVVGDTLSAMDAELIFSDNTTAPATGLTWSTSSKSIVSVNATTGELTAHSKGTATITAKTAGGLKDTCKVTVTSAPTGITLSPSSVKLSAGGMRFQLSASISGVSTANVTFKSSNPTVATVSQSGQITTVKKGNATITATTSNGKTAACAVTVTAVPAKASFTATQVTLTADESVIPYVRVQAADGSEAAADLSFRILAGQKCVDLNTITGEITAVATGTAVIGVSTHNGVSASNTFTVKVVAEPTGISLSPTTATLGAGESVSLNANVHAIQGADTSVKWSSSNTSVATVSSSGKVTAKSIGSATITAQTVNGIKATCQVYVYNAPTTLALSPASGSVYVDEVGQYSVKLSSASAGKITFTSSDPAIASVDDEGIVYGHAVGTVTITATAYNGVSGTARLTVKLRTTSGGGSELNETIERVVALAESQLGVKYKSKGGYKDSNPSSFDCSGLTYWCYYQVGIKLGDTPKKQADDSKYTLITKIEDLKRGDIVCFKSDTSSTVNHVGLYRGNGEFVNASESAGKVIVTDIHKNYYTRNFVCARRIIE